LEAGERSVCIELIRCNGHPNVQLTHGSTLELTSSDVLTTRGDCVACVSCRLRGRCLARRGLGKLMIAALGLEPPYVATSVVDGIAAGNARPERMVVRRSSHPVDTLLASASRPAAGLPGGLRRLLASSFTRCLALLVVLEVEPEDVLAGSIVEDTGDSEESEARG
jgi:hypothetical protein